MEIRSVAGSIKWARYSGAILISAGAFVAVLSMLLGLTSLRQGGATEGTTLGLLVALLLAGSGLALRRAVRPSFAPELRFRTLWLRTWLWCCVLILVGVAGYLLIVLVDVVRTCRATPLMC